MSKIFGGSLSTGPRISHRPRAGSVCTAIRHQARRGSLVTSQLTDSGATYHLQNYTLSTLNTVQNVLSSE